MNGPRPSRRQALRLLASASILPLRTAWAGPPARALSSHAFQYRAFRADAVVTLLSAPIFSRQGVGGGYLAVEESADAVALEFAGGSLPGRAHGVNRMGLFRERRSGDHAAFFGFMTASPEQSLGDARRSLQPAAGEVKYVAVTGEGRGGRFHCRRREIALPAQYTWEDCSRLASSIRGGFDPTAPAQPLDTGAPESFTFLDSVRRAMRGEDREFPFAHNGKQYRLRAESKPDARMGRRLVQRGLPVRAESVQRLAATIAETATGSRSSFQLWYDPADAAALPLRFEFHARSFLRVAFEWDPTARAAPLATSLIDKENA